MMQGGNNGGFCMVSELKKQFAYFIKNQIYIISLLVVTLFGYSYFLTHTTCGVDDISINVYFEMGLGVAIGRWPYYVINKLIPIAHYMPFFSEAVMLVLMMVAAIVLSCIIRYVAGDRYSIWCYVMASCLFMTFSITNEVYIYYLQNGIGFCYVLPMIALFGLIYYAQSGVCYAPCGWRITTAVFLTIAISFYETAASIFLTGAMIFYLMEIVYGKRQLFESWRTFFQYFLWVARYLIYAMILRRVIRSILMRVFHIQPYLFYRSFSITEIIRNIRNGELLIKIWDSYYAAAVGYVSVLIFVIFSILFACVMLYHVIHTRKWQIAVPAVMTYLSLFALCFLQNGTMQYRAAQVLNLFVACVGWMLTVELVRARKSIRVAGWGALLVMIMVSVADLNYWFALDYRRTAYEWQVIDRIAEDLQSGDYDIQHKPIVVVGDFAWPDEIQQAYGNYSEINTSLINWSVAGFSEYVGFNYPIRQMFEYQGYTLQWASPDVQREAIMQYYTPELVWMNYGDEPVQRERYIEQYAEEESYPNDGYIVERDTYIVIRL